MLLFVLLLADRGSSGGPPRLQECLRAGLQVSLAAAAVENYSNLKHFSPCMASIGSVNTVSLCLSSGRPYKDAQG